MIAYRIATDEEQEGICSEEYSLLLGPDGWMCFLGEPEDSNWWRDGKKAVERLNEQAEEIERLRARYQRLQSELSEAKKAGTPYAAERDAINGLILESQRLQSEMDALQSLDGINWHKRALKAERLVAAQKALIAEYESLTDREAYRDKGYDSDDDFWPIYVAELAVEKAGEK